MQGVDVFGDLFFERVGRRLQDLCGERAGMSSAVSRTSAAGTKTITRQLGRLRGELRQRSTDITIAAGQRP